MILTSKNEPGLSRICLISDLAFTGEERAPHGVIRHQIDTGTVFVNDGSLFTGFAIVAVKNGEPYLWSIAVLPAYQGCGDGGRLLDEVTKNFSPIGLTCRADNPAQKLYFDHGFRVTTVLKKYYQSCDGLFMRRQI